VKNKYELYGGEPLGGLRLRYPLLLVSLVWFWLVRISDMSTDGRVMFGTPPLLFIASVLLFVCCEWATNRQAK
jgi:hypothetical protein